jgi:hypothetical protein
MIDMYGQVPVTVYSSMIKKEIIGEKENLLKAGSGATGSVPCYMINPITFFG